MFNKLSDGVQRFQLILGTISISIFFITILIQVVARYAEITVMWTGEVSTNAFIWSVFMGAGVMARDNKHFAFDSFKDKLKGKNKYILLILISLIVLAFSLAITYYGIVITNKFWNYRLISIPNVKKGYMWLCLPIFGISSSIYSFGHVIEYVKKIKDGSNTDQPKEVI